jgi:hypothetical protein
LLQRETGAQRVALSGDEELDLLGLGEGGVAGAEGDEAFAKFIDRAGVPKSRVHQLHKLQPCRATAVEFHVMEPQLGVAQEAERG